MKRSVILALLIFAFGTLGAQILDPVEITHTVKKISDSEVELQVTAIMDEGWHIYSIHKPEDSYVISTEFNVPEASQYKLVGGTKEPKPIEEYDPNFEEVLKFHDNKATFSQRIRVMSERDFKIKAEFVYQTCNDRTCLTPEYVDLTFNVKGVTAPKVIEKPDDNFKPKEGNGNKAMQAQDVAPGVEPESLEIDYAATEEFEEDVADTAGTEEVVSYDTSGGEGESRTLLTIFILSFLGGFAALLTPCVFPMIPLTVSFFTKQSKSRAKGIANAVIYGISIIVLYTLLGYIITLAFGSAALNAFSTNPYVNIAFFLLLVIFAISFFGAFEITLPSSWANRSDRASDKGGIIGIFFMAFTLALISFSCTGPIIGTLLFEASTGGIQGPLIGMFGFSLALALPFTLFAAFPGWLNSLPKSGGWLNSVKVVLGFIELAFAFKFLSTADLVWQAGILKREWFIAIWIAIFVLMTLYLLGKFRMPHDSPTEKVSVFRLMLAIATMWFVVYLIPGMWGAPLKLISGFPPPMFYAESPGGFGSSDKVAISASEIPEGADPEHCPHELNCFHDFEEGLAYAKKVDKPIMLDFTGWGCVNCRKMEEQVWSDPRVLQILRDELVLISLYVDERELLPEDEQYISEVTGKSIETIGNKWSEFQVKHYRTNSQPQYIIIGHNSLKPLIESTAYDPDIEQYLKWLERGISEFEQQQSTEETP